MHRCLARPTAAGFAMLFCCLAACSPAEKDAKQCSTRSAPSPPDKEVKQISPPLVPPLQDLIDASSARKSISEHRLLDSLPNGVDASTVESYLTDHPDYTAYHLLLMLRKVEPKAYERVPSATKAAILCSALATSTFLNDWGNLNPAGSFDDESAEALLELGNTALPPLRKLLDDKRPAPSWGSAEATMPKGYKYRRADYAYRYIMVIQGHKPLFLATPAERDPLIDALTKELDSAK